MFALNQLVKFNDSIYYVTSISTNIVTITNGHTTRTEYIGNIKPFEFLSKSNILESSEDAEIGKNSYGYFVSIFLCTDIKNKRGVSVYLSSDMNLYYSMSTNSNEIGGTYFDTNLNAQKVIEKFTKAVKNKQTISGKSYTSLLKSDLNEGLIGKTVYLIRDSSIKDISNIESYDDKTVSLSDVKYGHYRKIFQSDFTLSHWGKTLNPLWSQSNKLCVFNPEFSNGDNVYLSSINKTGIVFGYEDKLGHIYYKVGVYNENIRAEDTFYYVMVPEECVFKSLKITIKFKDIGIGSKFIFNDKRFTKINTCYSTNGVINSVCELGLTWYIPSFGDISVIL